MAKLSSTNYPNASEQLIVVDFDDNQLESLLHYKYYSFTRNVNDIMVRPCVGPVVEEKKDQQGLSQARSARAESTDYCLSLTDIKVSPIMLTLHRGRLQR